MSSDGNCYIVAKSAALNNLVLTAIPYMTVSIVCLRHSEI